MFHQLPLRHPIPAEPEFIDPLPNSRRSRVHPRVRRRQFPRDEVVTVDDGPLAGLSLTSIARTAVDLACLLPLPAALAGVDAAARREALERVGVFGLRGSVSRVLAESTAMLSSALVAQRGSSAAAAAISSADPRRESPPESYSAAHIVEAGLPPPTLQARLRTSVGDCYPDFYWDTWGVVGECDGWVKYDGTFGPDDGVLVRQYRRQRAMEEDLGLMVVRWHATDAIHRPQVVQRAIAGGLLSRGWDPSDSPMSAPHQVRRKWP